MVHSPLFNKLYLFGGSDGKSVFKDVWVYDLNKESWEKLANPEEVEESKQEWTPYPKARFSHAACLDELFKDRMYIYGGSGIDVG